MSRKPPAAPSAADVIWLCRRLASALQADQSILCALDATAGDAPAALTKPLRSIRQRVRAGGRISDALVQLQWPSFVWGMVRNGEVRNAVDTALTLIADRLEAEQAVPVPKNRNLHAFAIALARLGVMLGVGVPVLTALETAPAAAPRSHAHDALMGARAVVRRGAELSDALVSLAAEVPDLTIEMIRDAERDGRLGDALPVIADYLLDAAGEARPRRKKQEV